MITTSELAKLAGVSQSTISRCLNDHPSISFKTKEKVQKLALKYGYVEHKKGKRTLFSGIHRVIGILTEEDSFFDQHFVNYAINKLVNTASAKNYYIIRLPLSSHEEGSMERLREFLKLNLIDGFIIMHRNFDDDIHKYLTELGIPHVYFLHCSRTSYEVLDVIDSDNYVGGYLGTQYLINNGHENILTVTCPWREFEDRTNGYKQALKENDIRLTNEFILSCSCTYKDAYELTMARIATFKKATAVYVQSDIMAVGVINALTQSGLRVPEDISVLGFDGYALGKMTNPPFDSVAHPIGELAELTITRLIQIISSAKKQIPQQILLQPRIVKRGSVKALTQ